MLIQNGNIVKINGVERADIRVLNGKIAEIGKHLTPQTGEEIVHANGKTLTAGFVDIHTHGGYGADFMDCSFDAFEKALTFHLDNGTTTVVPTSCTAPQEQIVGFLAFAKEYMQSLTHDIFEANVYCLTPKGRVIDLPNGATPIDFAYKIHTQVGHTMIGAIVNGTMVPLSTVLKTGDVVDIKTNKNTGPSEGWLHIAKTSYALNHIRKYLLKQNVERNRDDYILNGKMYFEIACKDDGLNVTECLDFLSDEKNKKYLPFDSIEDMFLAIGQRHITAGNITSKIKAEKRTRKKEEEPYYGCICSDRRG